jgi:hypothetical protein
MSIGVNMEPRINMEPGELYIKGDRFTKPLACNCPIDAGDEFCIYAREYSYEDGSLFVRYGPASPRLDIAGVSYPLDSALRQLIEDANNGAREILKEEA